MKKLFVLMVLVSTTFSFASSGKKTDEEKAFSDFLVKEVLPAFKHFKSVYFQENPSLELQYLEGGIHLIDCYVPLVVKQFTPLNYALYANKEANLEAKAILGQKVLIKAELTCSQDGAFIDIMDFNVKLSFSTDQGKKTHYKLIVNAYKQNQTYINLDELNLRVKIHQRSKSLLMAKGGSVVDFKKSFYAKRNGDVFVFDREEWNPMVKVKQTSRRVEAKKVKSLSRTEINGKFKFKMPSGSSPVGENGLRIPQKSEGAVKGFIYSLDDGRSIPSLDISMGKK